jgi:hypothetical protein
MTRLPTAFSSSAPRKSERRWDLASEAFAIVVFVVVPVVIVILALIFGWDLGDPGEEP